MALSSGFGRRGFSIAGWRQGVCLLALLMAQMVFGLAGARPLAAQAARTETAQQAPERAHSLNTTVVTATKTEAGVQDIPQSIIFSIENIITILARKAKSAVFRLGFWRVFD